MSSNQPNYRPTPLTSSNTNRNVTTTRTNNNNNPATNTNNNKPTHPPVPMRKQIPPRVIGTSFPGQYCEACGLDTGHLHEGLRLRYKIIVCRSCVENSPTEIPPPFLTTGLGTVPNTIKSYHPDVYIVANRYQSITKTTAKNDYLLHDDDFLAEQNGLVKEQPVVAGAGKKPKQLPNPNLPSFEVKNPHSNSFATMKLYLLVHVLDVAYKKHGGATELANIQRKKAVDLMNDQVSKRAFAQRQELIIQHGKENEIDPTLTLGRLLIEEKRAKVELKLQKLNEKIQFEKQKRVLEEGLSKEEEEDCDSGGGDEDGDDGVDDVNRYESATTRPTATTPTRTGTTQNQHPILTSVGVVGTTTARRELDLISQWYSNDLSGSDDDCDLYQSDSEDVTSHPSALHKGLKASPGSDEFYTNPNGAYRELLDDDNDDYDERLLDGGQPLTSMSSMPVSTSSTTHRHGEVDSDSNADTTFSPIKRRKGNYPQPKNKNAKGEDELVQLGDDSPNSDEDGIPARSSTQRGWSTNKSRNDKQQKGARARASSSAHPEKKSTKGKGLVHTHSYVWVAPGLEECECGAKQEFEEL